MIKRARAAVFHAAIVLISISGVSQAYAGDCVARVVGVKPISQYNHARGNGFLAVRTGPGSSYQQIGEAFGVHFTTVGRAVHAAKAVGRR